MNTMFCCSCCCFSFSVCTVSCVHYPFLSLFAAHEPSWLTHAGIEKEKGTERGVHSRVNITHAAELYLYLRRFVEDLLYEYAEVRFLGIYEGCAVVPFKGGCKAAIVEKRRNNTQTTQLSDRGDPHYARMILL